MKNPTSLQEAANNLAIIRRAIDRANKAPGLLPANRLALEAGILFQGICLVIALALIAHELLAQFTMTQTMLLSAGDQQLGVWGLAQVATVAPVLVMCLYFIVWRAARHNDEGFDEYVGRNFHYLRNLSFVSDLLVKSAPLALLVLGGHPEWIAPLLSLYVGDYLIQGRFFNLPVRLSLSLGVACVAAAAAQYAGHWPQLLVPLVVFAVPLGLSLFSLGRARAARQA